MGKDGPDYSNIVPGGEVNVTHPMHASQHEDGGSDEISVEGLSGELADEQPAKAHVLGGAKHTAATLAQLNALILDATLDDVGDTRTPATHTHKVWKTLVFCIPGTLTTGTKKAPSVVADADMDIDKVYIYVQTAPTGASIIVDVTLNDTTIFTDQGKRPEIAIDGNEDESNTPDVTSVAKNDVFDVDTDQVGSTVAGSVLSIFVRCKQDTTT